MLVETIKSHSYASKRRTVGEKYEIAGVSDLRLFLALNVVKVADAKPAAVRFDPPAVKKPAVFVPVPVEIPAEPAVETVADPEPVVTPADPEAPPADETPKPAAKRAYRRRDLTAEE